MGSCGVKGENVREEEVTASVVSWLKQYGWRIVAIAYPGSGSGVVLRPKTGQRAKNPKGTWIPDVIAERNGVWVFIESKPVFDKRDFLKVNTIITSGLYDDAIINCTGVPKENVFVGVAFADHPRLTQRSLNHISLVDFIILIEGVKRCRVLWQSNAIFP